MTPSPSDTAALVERLVDLFVHESDCALHNGPALPPSPCSCDARVTAIVAADIANEYFSRALSALAETQARLAHADRVVDRARQLCAAWPPHKEFDTDVVALEVELSMLVYGYDVSAPPAAAAERGETT